MSAAGLTEPFIAFATVLRRHGFPVAAEQTIGFLASLPLLGPRGWTDVYRAAHALFGPPPERYGQFDALFRAHFLGVELPSAPGDGDDEGSVRARDDAPALWESPDPTQANETGEAATTAEVLGLRALDARDEDIALRQMAALAPRHLPRRRGHRHVPARRGRQIDLQRALREQARHDGDAVRLPRRRRKLRQRRILVLIDVSGSMKGQTDTHLRFAHALARAAERIEVFTMGTRLTRVTRAIRLRTRAQALAEASQIVADWDGGTRLGDALVAFLGVPRFAAAARGALVLVLSDGLERGDPSALVDAVRRLSRLAWRIAWLSPLVTAGEPPQTEAMRALRPLLHELVPGGSTAALVAHVLRERREAA